MNDIFAGSGPETSVHSLFSFYTTQETHHLTEAMTQGMHSPVLTPQ
jgi:hypothetical protein